MHMKTRLAMFAAAASALALSGCGETTSGNDGGGSRFCSLDSQCASGEICHPTGKTCVKTCTAGADCPSAAKNCALPAFATTGPMVCNCATDQLCNGGTAGSICSAYDTVCTPKCASNSDCPGGRTCETSSGQCQAPTSGSDAGTGCMQGTCTGGKICNFDVAGGSCETPKACVTANVQPDTCSYAQFCDTGTCAEIPQPSCGNFPAGSNPLAWDPLLATGPVIWKGAELTPIDAAFCHTNQFAYTLQLSAYRTDADWPQTLAAVPGFKYVTSAATETDATTSMRPSGYVPGGKAATFKLTLCSTTSSGFTAGFYFTGGNAVCVPLANSTAGTTP